MFLERCFLATSSWGHMYWHIGFCRYLLSDPDTNIITRGSEAENHAYWHRDDESLVSYSSFRDPYTRRYSLKSLLVWLEVWPITWPYWCCTGPKIWMVSVLTEAAWTMLARWDSHMLRYPIKLRCICTPIRGLLELQNLLGLGGCKKFCV